MTHSSAPTSSRSKKENPSKTKVASKTKRSRNRRSSQNSDVLISAVISPYLLTHLHHLLQRAEYGASQEGRTNQAENFAQLRKVLCMDARSMKDASALGLRDNEIDNSYDLNFGTKVA